VAAILTPNYNPSLGLAWHGMWHGNFAADESDSVVPDDESDSVVPDDEASTDAQ
jgi:hypothetical protein